MAPSPIEIGWISRAHGLRGEVLVRLHNPESDLVSPGRQLLGTREGEERQLTVLAARTGRQGLLVAFDGVADRAAAEALRGHALKIDRDALPAPAEGEYYYADLEGFRVLDTDGGEVGRVVRVLATHVDVLVVSDGAREHWIPFVEPIVGDIDETARTIIVDPPEGLLDLAE